MKEYIWFKSSKNRNVKHKRNKNISNAKKDLLEKAGWVEIKGEFDNSPIQKPKPNPKPKPKPKKTKKEDK